MSPVDGIGAATENGPSRFAENPAFLTAIPIETPLTFLYSVPSMVIDDLPECQARYLAGSRSM